MRCTMLPGFCRKLLQASVDKTCKADIYPATGTEKLAGDGGLIMAQVTADKQRRLLVSCRECFAAIDQVMAEPLMAIPVDRFSLTVFVITQLKTYGYIISAADKQVHFSAGEPAFNMSAFRLLYMMYLVQHCIKDLTVN
jgi:hypothetical protein